MEKILNYQASFFGDFSNLKATEENISIFLNKLNKFIFMPMPMTSIDIRTNKLMVDNRMQFLSSDRNYFITILPERIDFTYNYNPQTISLTDFKEIQKDILNLIELLEPNLSGTKGNRIANSTIFVLSNFQDRTTLNEFIKKFSNKSIFYQDENDIIEWQLRYNSRRNIVANGKAENSNAIINLNIPNNPELNNSVLMSVDINTDPRNNSPRFVINDLTDYVKNATPVFIELENKAKND